MEKRKLILVAEAIDMAIMQTSFINKIIRYADANNLDRNTCIAEAVRTLRMVDEETDWDRYNISTAKL